MWREETKDILQVLTMKVGLLLFYLYQALFSHKMFELELFQAGTHADGF